MNIYIYIYESVSWTTGSYEMVLSSELKTYSSILQTRNHLSSSLHGHGIMWSKVLQLMVLMGKFFLGNQKHILLKEDWITNKWLLWAGSFSV